MRLKTNSRESRRLWLELRKRTGRSDEELLDLAIRLLHVAEAAPAGTFPDRPKSPILEIGVHHISVFDSVNRLMEQRAKHFG